MIRSVPEEGFTSTISKVIVGNPSFIEKIGQRLRWSSKVFVSMEAKKVERNPTTLASETGSIFSTQPGLLSTGSGLAMFHPSGTSRNTGLGLLPPPAFTTEIRSPSNYLAGLLSDPGITQPSFREIKREGTHIFEVIWEVTLSVRETLLNPKVIEIRHHETSWST